MDVTSSISPISTSRKGAGPKSGQHDGTTCQSGFPRSENDQARLAAFSAYLPIRRFDPGDVIYSQGDPAKFVYSLVSGWVGLHRDMVDGRRHIVKFLLAGALFGLEPRGVAEGQGATAITNIAIRAIPLPRFDELQQRFPQLNEGLVAMLERDNHLAAEALMMMSLGTAAERVARILWEFAIRLSDPATTMADLVFAVPLTQRLIANATGLTPIHVNRILRSLRINRLVELNRGVMIVRDLRKLTTLAGATPELTQLWRTDAASSLLFSPGDRTSGSKEVWRPTRIHSSEGLLS